MITQLSESVFVETYEEQRRLDIGKMQEDLARMKSDRMEIKKVPDQETLDYWNNEAIMRNEGIDAYEQKVNETIAKVKDAGFLKEVKIL